MAGRYLRKKRDGMRDPTMTHVDDPYAFQVGDWVRGYEGWDYIRKIDDLGPDLRFIHLQEGGDSADFDHLLPDPGAVDPRLADMRLHDLR